MQPPLSIMLKSRRKLRGLTQAQLAEKLDISRVLVAMWERGSRFPDSAKQSALERILKFDARAYRLRPSRRILRRGRRMRRRVLREAYPIGSTIAQVLNLGAAAAKVHDDARSMLSEDAYNDLVEAFPRDTRHELLFLLHIVRQAGSVVTCAPQWLGCPLTILDDFHNEYAGHQRQIALEWKSGDEQMVVFGQNRILTSAGKARRVDFLVYFATRELPYGQWMYVELDGSLHLMTPNQDELRQLSLPMPEIRYDNVMVESADFFGRLLSDLRKRALHAAQWALERRRAARKWRREREDEAAQRRRAS